jgi:hypothetical protein
VPAIASARGRSNIKGIHAPRNAGA